jgi:hypothetical protein
MERGVTSSIAVQLTANGEKLVQSTGGYLRTISQQAREAARDIAGNTSGAIEAGFKDGMRGIEREYRANIKSLEDLTRSASLTNGAVKFDRSAHNAELQAARERLEVQQRLAVALDRVAAEQGENAAAARVQAAATSASIQRAEEEVRALERKALVLDRLQAELGDYAVAQTRMTALTGEARQGAQQLSYQVADIASGFAAGIPPMQIFAQQSTQVVQSMQLMTRSTTGLLGFLGGPWGLIITSAITVLGSFAMSLLNSDDAAKKAEKSTLDFTNVMDFKKLSILEFKDAIDQLNQSTERLMNTQAIALDNQSMNAQKAVAEAQRRLSMADKAIAGGGMVGQVAAAARVQLVDNLEKARKSLDQTRTELQARALEESVDRSKGERAEIERQIAQLKEMNAESRAIDRMNPTARNYAIREKGDKYVTNEDYERRTRDLLQRQKTLQDQRKPGDASGRDARVGDMVALIKQLFPGAQITSTTGGKHAKGSDHYAGRAIDFVVPGMMNPGGMAEIERRLEEAGVDIRRNANGTKQLFGPGRSANKPGDHNDHAHVAWKGSPDPERTAEAQQRAAERAAEAAAQLARNVGEAGERASALRSQFDPLPADLDRASNALIDIQQEIAKNQALLQEKGLGADQAKALQAAIVDLELTRDKLIPASMSKPLRDDLAAMQEAIEGQQLLVDGRRAEYDRLQDNVDLARLLGAESTAQLGTMIAQRGITDAQLKAYYDQRDVLRAQTIELQRQQEEQQKLLQVVDDVASSAKSAIYDLFDGKGLAAGKNFFKSLFDIQKRVLTEEVYTAVFGDAFEAQKLKILGLDKVDETGRAMAVAIDRTIDPILALGDAARTAAGQLGKVAANDNSGVLSSSGKSAGGGGVVGKLNSLLATENGRTDLKTLGKTAGGTDIVVTAKRTMQQEMRDSIQLLGDKVLGPKLAGNIGKAVGGAMRGAAMGEMASGVLRSLGVKQSKTGAQIGGAIGSFVPIPGGEIIGGLIGGTIGGLFKKTPRGYATIGAGGIASTGGNSKAAKEAGTGAAGATIDSLESIAKALGGTFDPSKGSVSIGRSGDSWHVDTTGQGKLKKSQGGLDFNDDYEAAVRAATMDLIKDGVITGISAASQRILQSGKDLQQAIEKAALIESIPKMLRARTNPVAAALDELNDKWDRTVAILKEGGATAEQYADAQKLYELERADLMKAANDNLKSFIDSMNFGPNSGLSLRDQSANARTELQPYLDAIAKGDVAGVDRDKYLAAADSYMQISRALNGSGTGYFNTVDELRKATQSLLDQSVNQAKTAEARDPFAEQTAKSSQASANLLEDQNKLIAENTKWLQQISQSLGGGSVDFIGSGRLFVGNGTF